MNNPELLPCPFCGSDDVNLYVSRWSMEIYVQCNTCLCRGPEQVEGDIAILDWNNRAPMPLPAPPEVKSSHD